MTTGAECAATARSHAGGTMKQTVNDWMERSCDLSPVLPRRVGNEQRSKVTLVFGVKNFHDHKLVVPAVVNDLINTRFDMRQGICEKGGDGFPLDKRFPIHQSVLHFGRSKKLAGDVDLVSSEDVYDNMAALGETLKQIAVRPDGSEKERWFEGDLRKPCDRCSPILLAEAGRQYVHPV